VNHEKSIKNYCVEQEEIQSGQRRTRLRFPVNLNQLASYGRLRQGSHPTTSKLHPSLHLLSAADRKIDPPRTIHFHPKSIPHYPLKTIYRKPQTQNGNQRLPTPRRRYLPLSPPQLPPFLSISTSILSPLIYPSSQPTRTQKPKTKPTPSPPSARPASPPSPWTQDPNPLQVSQRKMFRPARTTDARALMSGVRHSFHSFNGESGS
jgi:hypothetical protein